MLDSAISPVVRLTGLRSNLIFYWPGHQETARKHTASKFSILITEAHRQRHSLSARLNLLRWRLARVTLFCSFISVTSVLWLISVNPFDV